jgi:hypothetical protein
MSEHPRKERVTRSLKDRPSSYFATCNLAEAMLLESLAFEHSHHLKLKHIETPHATQIITESDSEPLRDYVHFMLQRFRDRQRHLERMFQSPEHEKKELV